MERDAGDWEGKGKEGIEKEGWVVKKYSESRRVC